MPEYPNYRVSVEIVLCHNDKILLTKRSAQATVVPGVWNVPAGKVKFHEIPLDAAYRELLEETNIKVVDLKEIHVRTFKGQTETESIFRLIYTYKAIITDDQLGDFRLNEEHTDYAWVTTSEIADSRFDSLLPEFRGILMSHTG